MGTAARVRMTPEERRRQLVGVGLRMFVERPVGDLSVDEVAAAAGVSRGLLFHYFPTKSDYHRAVVAAAGRRVRRNVTPDEGMSGEAAVRQVVARFLDQVERRREWYVALVRGRTELSRATPDDPLETVTAFVADLACRELALPPSARPAARGWVAYLEDRALQWAALDPAVRDAERADLVEHCVGALRLLTAPRS
ncbi:TetR/AcrR family transcriptional regulator [Phycicoccus sonneratiae]|uniref:TetR/AcrR family transcriptional regulator n=1 Tax=Phycicoccus sonneratiae TaxID=2807628 RepID=A0ABS2CPT7_9MICO|nr:TetR/AcrR family transcriptional regulator [Phycicoccus sonneraticus]MBM6401894.1 TetR/AcrR family transcriptional regulator [Phycicoccus sonneraticus]